jgi:hypothetical protein
MIFPHSKHYIFEDLRLQRLSFVRCLLLAEGEDWDPHLVMPRLEVLATCHRIQILVPCHCRNNYDTPSYQCHEMVQSHRTGHGRSTQQAHPLHSRSPNAFVRDAQFQAELLRPLHNQNPCRLQEQQGYALQDTNGPSAAFSEQVHSVIDA